MLKVNDEILKKIGLEYAFIISKGNSFLRILSLGPNVWNVKMQDPSALEGNSCILVMKYGPSNYQVSVSIRLVNADIYQLIFPNDQINELNETVKKLEKKMNEWSRRKEIRLEVGISGSESFGLKEKKQKLIDGEGNILDCAVKDVSYHGMKIVTTDRSSLKQGSYVTIMLTMKSEPAIIIHAKVCSKILQKSRTGSGMVFAILSLQVMENLMYQEKVEVFEKLLSSKIA